MGSFTNLLIMAFVVVSFPLYCGSLTTAAPMDQASGERLFAVRCVMGRKEKVEEGLAWLCPNLFVHQQTNR
jgi:hypothetical protein